MVRAWQLRLSPRPLHRTKITSQTSFTTAGNAARLDFIPEEDGRWSLRETHHIDNPLVRAGKSGPPLHIHLLQDEYFQVEQGVLGAITNGKEHAITKDDGILTIQAGTRHRFWSHPSATESLVFHGWINPQGTDDMLDKNALRNIQGYFADCHRANLKPSVFQLILFAYSTSTVMTPPFWVPVWLLTAIHHVLAYWIAQGLLGYQSQYPEYTVKLGSEQQGTTDK